MPNFPIDERGYTFSHVLDRKVKLSPAMQRLVRALNQHGNVDPVRDCGRGTGVNTVVALMDRGILRETRGRWGVHQPATTPAQVWDEAHDEDARRDVEVPATFDFLSPVHERITRGGARPIGTVLLIDGDRLKVQWPGWINWHTADELDPAYVDENPEGWGQPDGMLGDTEADLLHLADLAAARADGIALPIVPPTFPVGTPEYAAYAAKLRAELAKFAAGEEPYPYGSAAHVKDVCGCDRNPLGHSRAEHPVKREYSAQLGGYVVQDVSGRWHREPTIPAEDDEPVIIEAHVEQMNETTERMEIPRARWNAMTPAERRAKIDTFGTETMNNCGGYGASIISGAPDSDLDDQPNTPAETRTGISDRAAAALADVAEVRAFISATAAPDGEAYAARNRAMAALDRIEAARRERR